MTRRIVALSLAALVASCSADETKPRTGPAPQDREAALGGEIAARISAGSVNDVVPVSVVAAVAAEQKIAPADAARRVVDDAVAAAAARERGLDRSPPAAWLLVAARARFTADRLRAEAKAAGPPTDDEVKELTLRHWREVDRPVSARVVHFVVKRPSKATPAGIEAARHVAEELRTAILDAKTPEQFLEQAKTFPHPKDVDVHAESLPPFTDDGYSIEGPDVFDEAFVKAAHRIEKPGDTSPVIETKFGWHVIRLVERVPEQRMPFESRRIAFTEEAYVMRARRALESRLGPLRAANAVTIAPSAEQLMLSVMGHE